MRPDKGGQHHGRGDGESAPDQFHRRAETQQPAQPVRAAVAIRLRAVAQDRLPRGKLDDAANGGGIGMDQHQHAIVGRTQITGCQQQIEQADEPCPGLSAKDQSQSLEYAADPIARRAGFSRHLALPVRVLLPPGRRGAGRKWHALFRRAPYAPTSLRCGRAFFRPCANSTMASAARTSEGVPVM